MDNTPLDLQELCRVYRKMGRLGILMRYGLTEDQYKEEVIKRGAIKCQETLKEIERKISRNGFGFDVTKVL